MIQGLAVAEVPSGCVITSVTPYGVAQPQMGR